MQSHSTSHLGPWIQLQQPPAEVVAGVKVFQLEENAHRAAQAKRHVHRLQVAVREVGRQLRHTLGSSRISFRLSSIRRAMLYSLQATTVSHRCHLLAQQISYFQQMSTVNQLPLQTLTMMHLSTVSQCYPP